MISPVRLHQGINLLVKNFNLHINRTCSSDKRTMIISLRVLVVLKKTDCFGLKEEN